MLTTSWVILLRTLWRHSYHWRTGNSRKRRGEKQSRNSLGSCWQKRYVHAYSLPACQSQRISDKENRLSNIGEETGAIRQVIDELKADRRRSGQDSGTCTRSQFPRPSTNTRSDQLTNSGSYHQPKTISMYSPQPYEKYSVPDVRFLSATNLHCSTGGSPITHIEGQKKFLFPDVRFLLLCHCLLCLTAVAQY